MPDTRDPQFDPDRRRQELLEHFQSVDRAAAREQLQILPYYHQLENEVTKPNQGVFVTRYFQTKWRPSLGAECSTLVLALRLLADQKDGTTFAGHEAIAQTAGMSLRSVQRWLSDSPKAILGFSPERKSQWDLLHAYFIKSKTARYLVRKEGAVSRAKRTTNIYQVAMDDPVHPDDQGLLVEKAVQRIIRDEAEKYAKPLENQDEAYNRQFGGNRNKQILREDDPSVDNSAYNRQFGGHQAPPDWRSVSLSDRKTTNVDQRWPEASKGQRSERQATLFPRNPEAEALAWYICDRLTTMDPGSQPESRLKDYQLLADRLPRDLIERALVATRDYKDDRKIKTSAPRLFRGIVNKMAEQAGIELPRKGPNTPPVAE